MKDAKLKEHYILEGLSYRGAHINESLLGKAWVGHTPFVYWLITAIKPKILVELGTHGGGSYFSFCQSIKDHTVQTKAYAVDHWEGEAHAGIYTDTVYDKVKAVNDKNFVNFSKLLRKDFNHAKEDFSNGTVDLLHIDGFHSYDAVSSDFNSWFPKLSNDAVVLLHDTHERKEGFGVHIFWQELKEKYPEQCFEFTHSHGLGVIFPKSITAATNFRNSCGMEFDKMLDLFSIVGSKIYYDLKGKHLEKNKNAHITIEQLQVLLKAIKKNKPEIASNLRVLL